MSEELILPADEGFGGISTLTHTIWFQTEEQRPWRCIRDLVWRGTKVILTPFQSGPISTRLD